VKYYPKYILLLPVAIILITACTGVSPLMRAYKADSREMLRQYLDDWKRKTPLVNNEEFRNLNDTLKYAYDVYSAFIKILSSEFNNQNILLPDSIDVMICDLPNFNYHYIDSVVVNNIKTSVKSDSLKNILLKKKNGKLEQSVINQYFPGIEYHGFRNSMISRPFGKFLYIPDSSYCQLNVLLVTKEFKETINLFIYGVKDYGSGGFIEYYNQGYSDYPIPHYDISHLNISEEIKSRENFFNTNIQYLYSSFLNCDYCYLPIVMKFDKNLENVLIEYRNQKDLTGIIVMSNKDGNWELVLSQNFKSSYTIE